MKKRARQAWLILAVLVVLFGLLLLLLLCRVCGIFKESNGDTAKTDAAGVTDDRAGQETTGDLQPSVFVEFGSMTLDEEEVDPDTAGTTEGTSETHRTPTTATEAFVETGSAMLSTEQTEPSSQGVRPGSLNYEKYIKMSAQEQQQFFDDNFRDDPIAFAQWFQKVKQEYEQENPPIIVTGPINMEDYLNQSD